MNIEIKKKKIKYEISLNTKKRNKVNIALKKHNLKTCINKERKQIDINKKFNKLNENYEKKTMNSLSFISSISTIQDEQKLNKTTNSLNFNNSLQKIAPPPSRKKKSFTQISNKLMLDQEFDKFKNGIDNLMKIIENFEDEYINSAKPKLIKEELNKMTYNNNYFLKNEKNKSTLIENGNIINNNIKSNSTNKKIIGRSSCRTLNLNYNKINNKNKILETMSPTNKISKLLENSNNKNNKQQTKKNNLRISLYDRRINYGLVLSKKINEKKRKINNNKENLTNGKEEKEINYINGKSNVKKGEKKCYRYVSSKINFNQKRNNGKDNISNINNSRENMFSSPNISIQLNNNYIFRKKNLGLNNSMIELNSKKNKTENLNLVGIKRGIKHKSIVKSNRNIL